MTARACPTCRFAVDSDCTNPNDVPGLEAWMSANERQGVLVEGADGCPGWSRSSKPIGGATPPKSPIGNRLNAARIDRGLSWAQLATLIGVSGAQISRIKSGRQHGGPSLARCEAWLDSPPPHVEGARRG